MSGSENYAKGHYERLPVFQNFPLLQEENKKGVIKCKNIVLNQIMRYLNFSISKYSKT